MGEDPQFKDLEAPQVEAMARDVLASLDDLGVLLLFSAFEAIVRERITTEVAEDASAVSHPASLRRILINCFGVFSTASQVSDE